MGKIKKQVIFGSKEANAVLARDKEEEKKRLAWDKDDGAARERYEEIIQEISDTKDELDHLRDRLFDLELEKEDLENLKPRGE